MMVACEPKDFEYFLVCQLTGPHKKKNSREKKTKMVWKCIGDKYSYSYNWQEERLKWHFLLKREDP